MGSIGQSDKIGAQKCINSSERSIYIFLSGLEYFRPLNRSKFWKVRNFLGSVQSLTTGINFITYTYKSNISTFHHMRVMH